MGYIDVAELPSVPFDGRNTLLPAISACYLVLDCDGRVLYVGMSRDLSKRWKTHKKLAEVKALGASVIAYIATPEDKLGEVEKLLMDTFEPYLNKGHAGIGGLRDGAGRPKSDKPATRPMRVPITVKKEQVKALPQFKIVLSRWKEECANADPLDTRWDGVREFMEDIGAIGF